MKAKELRIGNYILRNISHPEPENVTALMILKQYQCDLSNDEYLRPIILTGELLLKFNFVKYAKFAYSYKGFKLFETKDCFYTNYLDIEIVHLHQLQNLYFALTNEEVNVL